MGYTYRVSCSNQNIPSIHQLATVSLAAVPEAVRDSSTGKQDHDILGCACGLFVCAMHTQTSGDFTRGRDLSKPQATPDAAKHCKKKTIESRLRIFERPNVRPTNNHCIASAASPCGRGPEDIYFLNRPIVQSSIFLRCRGLSSLPFLTG